MDVSNNNGKKDVTKESKLPESVKKPFKDYKTGPPAIRFVSPQSLPWGVLLILFYLIVALMTKNFPQNLITEIIASLRLLILTMGIFLSVMGLVAIILHPKDYKKLRPKIPLILKKKEKYE